MKLYQEMLNDIELMFNSDEYIKLQKEASELDILERYIDNQLYLFTYCENIIIDNGNINKIIYESVIKEDAWYQKIISYNIKISKKLIDLIIGTLKWIMKQIKNLYNHVLKINETNILQRIRNLLSVKNESYLQEDVNSVLSTIHDIFKNIYSDYYNKYINFVKKIQDKVDINNLEIKVNDVYIHDIINNKKTLSLENLQKLVSQDKFTFIYRWKDNENKFLMTSFETFEKYSNELVKMIDNINNDIDKNFKKASIIIAKAAIKKQLKNLTWKELIVNPIIILLLTILPQVYIPAAAVGLSTKACWLLFKSMGKLLYSKNQYNILFTNNLIFQLTPAIQQIDKDSQLVYNTLTEKINLLDSKITDFFEKHKNELQNIINNKNNFISNYIKAPLAKQLNNINNLDQMYNNYHRGLDNITNNFNMAEVSKYLQIYMNLYINMMSIISFSTSIRDILLIALRLDK